MYTFSVLTISAGIGSLIVFGVFLSRMSLGVVRLGLNAWAAAILDIALCLVFFVQHSGMVRRPFRAWSEHWIPGWLSRPLYTLASALALVLLALLWQTVDASPLTMGPAASIVIQVFSVLALLGFLWAFLSVEGLDLFGTQDFLKRLGRRSRPPGTLTVKGPYRWIRHPFYLLAIVLLWAWPVISVDRLLLGISFTIWIVLATRWEEKDLIAQYGDAYRRYQRMVPMLVPWKLRASARLSTDIE